MIDQSTFNKILLQARTHRHWQKKEINDDLLKKIYDAAKMGSTSANCNPLRIIFVKSLQAKEKLKECLIEGNIEQTMTAPVTAIFAYDLNFYEKLPYLFPHSDMHLWFIDQPDRQFISAFRNSTLQAAYFILAARAFGLDCGPMSGFDNKKVDELFFANSAIKSNFLCNLGYGDRNKLHPREPRFLFNEVCSIE